MFKAFVRTGRLIMNIIDKNPCLLGVFQWEVLALVLGPASIAGSQLPRGRVLGLAS